MSPYKRTRLGSKISSVMARRNMTQQQFALGCTLSQGTIVKLEHHGMRPGPDTLAKLCHCSAIQPEDGIDILCDHLRDEIQRARFAQETIDIRPADRDAETHGKTDAVAEALQTIGIIARSRPDVAALVRDLATTVSALRALDAPPMTKD